MKQLLTVQFVLPPSTLNLRSSLKETKFSFRITTNIIAVFISICTFLDRRQIAKDSELEVYGKKHFSHLIWSSS
jgi:hypothetical protein